MYRMRWAKRNSSQEIRNAGNKHTHRMSYRTYSAIEKKKKRRGERYQHTHKVYGSAISKLHRSDWSRPTFERNILLLLRWTRWSSWRRRRHWRCLLADSRVFRNNNNTISGDDWRWLFQVFWLAGSAGRRPAVRWRVERLGSRWNGRRTTELDQRKLPLHKMSKRRESQPFGSRFEMFHVLLVSRVNRFVVDVGRKNDGGSLRLAFGFAGRLIIPSGLFVLGSLDVTLQKGGGLLINVQREAIVRPFAVIAVHARSHSVRHDVLANPLQLVLRAILQVQEGFQADFLALSLSTSRQLDKNNNKKKWNEKAPLLQTQLT